MASSDILSQTLSSITSIKLEEIGLQRWNFEDGKAALLEAVAAEPDQREKVRILLDHSEGLASMSKLADSASVSLANIAKYLEQARSDPSVSVKMQKDWQMKIEKGLDVESLRYEYASLYGKLVKEWISIAEDKSDSASMDVDHPVEVGRTEMHEQRQTWEDYVFKARETDVSAIHKNLNKLFTSNPDVKAAYYKVQHSTTEFEKAMSAKVHFDEDSLKWVIQGLVRSDLVSDEKRKILKDFLSNSVVLGEVADVLNMRMASLDKWKWDPAGTPVELRRKLNQRYRFYDGGDLLQTILLRYIGVKWSVHFHAQLKGFKEASGVWKESSTPVPAGDRKRREYFLGSDHSYSGTVESQRSSHFDSDIFLEQMQQEEDEQRGGYDDDTEDEKDTRKSSHQITAELLQRLAAEIIMRTRLGEEVSVVRSDFKWFGPSLPHSTIFAVLKFFGVSEKWVSFFRRALEAPMKFAMDGADTLVQTRKRGTPISGPMSDMLAETTLFCLDFSFNQATNGVRLYRLHDDIWFFGDDKSCVKGWKVMTDFTSLMGLDIAEDKTGSVKVDRKGTKQNLTVAGLPKGDVTWGFLRLDTTGKWVINLEKVEEHTAELGRQLAACKSVFDWIQAWNSYGVRWFLSNFGTPNNSFGRPHVDAILDAFTRIQAKLFASTGGSVTSTLKGMLTQRFGVKDIPEGYLYFPASSGGLDLQSPFVRLYLMRYSICENPDKFMDDFFQTEESDYRKAKALFEKDLVPGRRSASFTSNLTARDFRGEPFMSFDEYTRYREQTSTPLALAYRSLLEEASEAEVETMTGGPATSRGATFARDRGSGRSRGRGRGRNGRVQSERELNPYKRWIIQLYGPDMIERFGGLTVVEKGLLPTGMVSMFRESRFKWQG